MITLVILFALQITVAKTGAPRLPEHHWKSLAMPGIGLVAIATNNLWFRVIGGTREAPSRYPPPISADEIATCQASQGASEWRTVGDFFFADSDAINKMNLANPNENVVVDAKTASLTQPRALQLGDIRFPVAAETWRFRKVVTFVLGTSSTGGNKPAALFSPNYFRFDGDIDKLVKVQSTRTPLITYFYFWADGDGIKATSFHRSSDRDPLIDDGERKLTDLSPDLSADVVNCIARGVGPFVVLKIKK